MEMPAPFGTGISAVIGRLEDLLRSFSPDDARRHFCAAYCRTTGAVRDALGSGRFADEEWVEAWDVAFARRYLDAIALADRGEPPPAPWQVAFRVGLERPALPPLRHVLLGINAHVNFDLPQALLDVTSDEAFDDPQALASKKRDHRAIDGVIAARVAAEDTELVAATPGLGTIDRLLGPLNRLGTKHFLREARGKVWSNALQLARARREGDEELRLVVSELSGRSVAKLEQLLAPGPVLLRLAAFGFGTELGRR
jgi:hypothetical protein